MQNHLDGGRGPKLTFSVDVPEIYDAQQTARLIDFLEHVGFSEVLFGASSVMNMSEVKIDELRRVLGSITGASNTLQNSGSLLRPPSPSGSVISSRNRSSSDPSDNGDTQTQSQGISSVTRTRSKSAIGHNGLSVITEGDQLASGALGVPAPISSGSRTRRVAAKFPPRNGALTSSIDSDRAESPAGFSPFASSPRFFSESGEGGPSPAGDDEVYPELGVGLQDLALNINRRNSFRAIPDVLNRYQNHSNFEGEEGSISEGSVSETSTILDADGETPFDPDVDVPVGFDRDTHGTPPLPGSMSQGMSTLADGTIINSPSVMDVKGDSEFGMGGMIAPPRHSGESILDSALLHSGARMSNVSDIPAAGGAVITSPIYNNSWGMINRNRDSDESAFSERDRDSGTSFQRNNKNIERKVLRRSVTMPTMHSRRHRPSLHPGQQTPCERGSGKSLSQGDPGKFNTPQSRADLIHMSGCGEADWGTSQPASEIIIQKMVQRLGMRYGKDFGKPGLFRSHSAEDFSPTKSPNNRYRSVSENNAAGLQSPRRSSSTQSAGGGNNGMLFGYPTLSSAVGGRGSGSSDKAANGSNGKHTSDPFSPVSMLPLTGGKASTGKPLLSGQMYQGGFDPEMEMDMGGSGSGSLGAFGSATYPPSGIKVKTTVLSRSQTLPLGMGGGTMTFARGDLRLGPEDTKAAELVAMARNAYQTREKDDADENDIPFKSIVEVEGAVDQDGISTYIDSINSRGSSKNRRTKNSLGKWRRQSLGGSSVSRSTRAGTRKAAAGEYSAISSLEAVGEGEGLDLDMVFEKDNSPLCPGVKTKSSTKKGRVRWAAAAHTQTDALQMLVSVPDSGENDRDSLYDSGDEEMRMSADQSFADGVDGVDVDGFNDGENSAESNAQINSFERLTDENAHRQPDVPNLNERTFKGIVVGGTYQQCFDDSTPVVAPCAGRQKRVTGVSVSANGSLELRLYVPSSNAHRAIDLGQHWRWMRSSPDGFLVFKDTLSIPMPKQTLLYYLARHPIEWAQDLDESGPLSGSRLDSSQLSAESSMNNENDFSLLRANEEHGAGLNGLNKNGNNSNGNVSWADLVKVSDSGEKVGTSFEIERGIEFGSGSRYSESGDKRGVQHRGASFDLTNRSFGSISHMGPIMGALGGMHASPEDFSRLAAHAQHTPGYYNVDGMLAALGREHDGDINMHMGGGGGSPDMPQPLARMDLSLSEDRQEASIDSDDVNVKMVLYADTAADWNQTSIVSYVLEFLLGDSGEAVLSQMSQNMGQKSGRGRPKGKRTQNKQQILEDYTSYRKVSKAWALGSYRLLAKHLSSPESSQMMPYHKYMRFAQRFPWGQYLASGACKSVYCVQNEEGLLEAVSIMNVLDLRARGMEAAIAKELEISLACSSIAGLNVCPNLVHVYSLFRSECPVPDGLWRNTTSPPPPPLPLTLSDNGRDLGILGGLDDPDMGPGLSLLEDQQFLSKNVLMGVKKQQLDLGVYQYIRQEFCSGGDLEEHVRSNGSLPAPTIRIMLFQMCFALYSCREQLSLRHFDIKLLNFLCTSASSLLPPDIAVFEARRVHSPFESFRDPNENILEMRVGFGHNIYCLPLLTGAKDLVKLGDFGTSAVGASGLGEPINLQQFTTLENVPPEYLLLGSVARQAFSADTFPLGLSFLHLLTGHEPYEVLLSDVVCPSYLIHHLRALWTPGDIEDQYYVIEEVVNTCVMDDDEAEASQGYNGAVLCHTLYRYFVMFGAPDEFISCNGDSPVWERCREALGLGFGDDETHGHTQGYGKEKRGRKPAAASKGQRDACRAQFQKDHALWSWKHGSHPIMRRLREKLEGMGKDGKAGRLLEKMTHFDPSRRCTMFDALCSPVFAPLIDHATVESGAIGYGHLSGRSSPRGSPRTSPRALQKSPANHINVRYMHYYRSLDDGGTEVLPMV